jgi:hypothetical protein
VHLFRISHLVPESEILALLAPLAFSYESRCSEYVIYDIHKTNSECWQHLINDSDCTSVLHINNVKINLNQTFEICHECKVIIEISSSLVSNLRAMIDACELRVKGKKIVLSVL